MWEQVKQSMIFYFSGYFLTTQEGVDSMMAVAKYSAQTEKQVQYKLELQSQNHLPRHRCSRNSSKKGAQARASVAGLSVVGMTQLSL